MDVGAGPFVRKTGCWESFPGSVSSVFPSKADLGLPQKGAHLRVVSIRLRQHAIGFFYFTGQRHSFP